MALGSISSRKDDDKIHTDEDVPSSWIRWILPSAADLLFVALFALLAFTTLSTRLLSDAGIGWHIRTGQLILQTHSIPRSDPFSSTMYGQPWFAWEWLYDLIVGCVERAAGLNGVAAFAALIIALTFSWTFRLLVRRGANIAVALVLMLLASSAAMIHFQARPHVVSWLFTLAWFWILESTEEICKLDSGSLSPRPAPRSWLIWLLPPLTVVWVNLHGGFLVGFVLLAIYWLCAAWRWRTLNEGNFENIVEKIRASRRLRTLTLAGLLCAAATLLNPYGFHLHLHIYGYLSNRFLMDHIDEFQSPNFHYVAQKCFAVLLLLALAALAIKGREVRTSHALVILFAVFSGLYAARNIPVASLLLILMIGPILSRVIDKVAGFSFGGEMHPRSFLQRMGTMELSLRGHCWPLAVVVFTACIAAHGGKLQSAPLMNAHFDARKFPVQAVDFLESTPQASTTSQGPVLSQDDWGGYLIYRLYPRIRVVVDDRHDLYGEVFLTSYLKMIHLEPGWQEFLEQHPAETIILPKDSAQANMLLETRGWRRVYADDVAIVFRRNPTKE